MAVSVSPATAVGAAIPSIGLSVGGTDVSPVLVSCGFVEVSAGLVTGASVPLPPSGVGLVVAGVPLFELEHA
jgi:hypothetical protein